MRRNNNKPSRIPEDMPVSAWGSRSSRTVFLLGIRYSRLDRTSLFWVGDLQRLPGLPSPPSFRLTCGVDQRRSSGPFEGSRFGPAGDVVSGRVPEHQRYAARPNLYLHFQGRWTGRCGLSSSSSTAKSRPFERHRSVDGEDLQSGYFGG